MSCTSTRPGPTSTRTSRSSIDATDDFGVSEGIDGRASSIDGAVRAAGAIAEHYAPRGERVSLRTFGPSWHRSVPPGTGRAQLRRILDTLALCVRPTPAPRRGIAPRPPGTRSSPAVS